MPKNMVPLLKYWKEILAMKLNREKSYSTLAKRVYQDICGKTVLVREHTGEERFSLEVDLVLPCATNVSYIYIKDDHGKEYKVLSYDIEVV